MLPLQFGVPGGPELLIIMLIFFLLGIPLLLVLAAVVLLRQRRSGRVEELESRVKALEAELQARRDE